MKIHSKFRTLYLIRINILFILFDFFCLSKFFGSFRTEDYKIALASVVFLAVSIFFHINKLSSVNEIIVSEKGIKRTTLASSKVEFIAYSSILRVEIARIQGSYSRGGQISTGYFESTIYLENGEEILISPDHFENYPELIVAIRDKVAHKTENFA
ncbi:hypothetical protein K6T82_06920 [Flavobacterium sp. 17A]|uniref:Uncharacterized protein n=1 Tax=Flavobacterium potami TaxID=2872310 RepID=A0A9X1KQS6_9FLAO|nr:DUF6585 family protein [Flavobacterium potami]MBZ4034491.1 hypothetical protein [Flavobacterium potami]